jgi:prevent-host-death family protein
MSKPVNLYEAKTHLSTLVDRAAKGEEIIIAKAGKPKARLVPLRDASVKRRPGAWRGRVRTSRDFDAPLPESIMADFEGRERDEA